MSATAEVGGDSFALRVFGLMGQFEAAVGGRDIQSARKVLTQLHKISDLLSPSVSELFRAWLPRDVPFESLLREQGGDHALWIDAWERAAGLLEVKGLKVLASPDAEMTEAGA